MEDYIRFDTGHRIKELRIDNNMSLEQLALEAGIATSYLSMLEHNKKNPTIKVISRICQALGGISLHEFFNDSVVEEYTDLDNLSKRLLYLVRYRSDIEKELLIASLQNMISLRDLPQ